MPSIFFQTTSLVLWNVPILLHFTTENWSIILALCRISLTEMINQRWADNETDELFPFPESCATEITGQIRSAHQGWTDKGTPNKAWWVIKSFFMGILFCKNAERMEKDKIRWKLMFKNTQKLRGNTHMLTAPPAGHLKPWRHSAVWVHI